MIAFIVVITMIAGYFVGLESRTIDNDAIAYRTGVILVEDPGYTANSQTSWELNDIDHTFNVLRFGLAYSDDPLGSSRNYPNILSSSKVSKFFNKTYFPTRNNAVSDDYQSRLMFGDRPYWYNISLCEIGGSCYPPATNALGDPNGYGYIRRVVKIREPGIVNIDAYFHNSTVAGGTYEIPMDFTALYSYSAPYLVDPLQDTVTIRINNLTNFGANLTEVSLVEAVPIQSLNEFVTIDGHAFDHSPYSVIDTINLTLEPGFFKTYASKSSNFIIRYTFSGPGYGMGGNSPTTNFTLGPAPYPEQNWPWPRLVPAVLEVKIW